MTRRTVLNYSIFTLLAATTASASMPREDYLKALQIAQKKVDRGNQAQGNAGALSSSMIKMLYGRYYQVGDRWKVAAWYSRSNQAAMVSDMARIKPDPAIEPGLAGVFEYEVTNVKYGPNPTVTMKITQLSSFGIGPVDKNIQSMRLTMNDRMLQDEKSYFVEGRADAVKVSPEGIHSSMTPLELFPLDVPELITADKQPMPPMPALPRVLDQIAKQTGYQPDLSQSQWFEQDDFFGRPVQVLWKTGDPWPAYQKTANGTAILLGAN